jgi:hypothetical protein
MIDRTRSGGTLVALLTIGVLAVGCGGSMASTSSTAPTTASASSTQTGSVSESSPDPGDGTSGNSVASSDGQVLPVKSNPISNNSTAPGLKIAQLLVEDNVNPATGKDAPDHLEIALRNDSAQELKGFEVYYQITDLTTGAKEGYHTKLDAFTIPAGGERVVHFDDSGAADHYPDNKYSLYHSSKNEMQFDVTVSATDVAPQTASVKKDAGGDENPDE